MLFGRAAETDIDIRLDGKKLNQRDSFVYSGGVFAGRRHGDGNSKNTSCGECVAESGRGDGR